MLPFILSVVDPATARSERGEENTERPALLPYPGFRSLYRRKGEKMSPACQYKNGPQIAASSSKNAVSFSAACTTKRFPLSRCASAIQIVCPLVSTYRLVDVRHLHPLLKELAQCGVGHITTASQEFLTLTRAEDR